MTVDPTDGTPTLIMHIPKTAGTSLRWIAEQQYPAGSFQSLYPGHEPQIEALMALAPHTPIAAVMGHFHHGLHTRLRTAARYVTVFRDPVDRVLSHFNHVKNVGDPEHRGVMPPHGGLTEFLEHEWARNLQTQYVAGMSAAGVEANPEEAFRHAANALDRDFVWFGLVERFNASMRSLAGRLAWNVSQIPSLNRSAERDISVTRSGLSEPMLRRIERVNACDVRLYAYARQASRKRFGRVSSARFRVHFWGTIDGIVGRGRR